MNKRLSSFTVFLIIIAASLFWVDGSKYLGSNSLHLPIFVRHAQAESGSSPDEVTTTNHCSITGSEIWSSTGNVHTIGVGCGDVVIEYGESLTITEGTIVKVDIGNALIVNGSLQVLGSSINPVYITSIRDDTIGGDTNGDGASSGVKGDWAGVRFNDSSADASLIEYAVIRYAGYNSYGNVHLDSASPTIQNTVLSNGVHPIRANLTSFPTLNGNTYVDNSWNAYGLDGGTVNINATWDITDTDYFIISDIYVGAGYTLTVEPGVIVKFQGGRALFVNGALRALGTTASPIYFTSLHDDAVGGNIDGGSTLPGKGNWCGIRFNDSSIDATSLIDHSVVRYAGCSDYGNIHLTSASPTIKNTVLSNGVHPIRANLTSFPTLSGNTYVDNSWNAYGLDGGTYNINATWDITDTDYFIINNIYVGVGYTLTVEPGVIVKFQGSMSLIVDGALRALGTEASPIYFTSNDDDAIGRNIDGGSALPVRGDWFGIQFRDNSNDATSLIDHAVVRYAGCMDYGNIHLTSASPTIQNTVLSNGVHPVRANLTSFPTLSGNTYVDNIWNAYGLDGGTYNINATWDITDTDYFIINNIYVGVGYTLTVEPGVIVKLLNRAIIVDGALRALGTPANPIYFTSLHDDAIGGNIDGGSTLPGVGNWCGLQFRDSSNDATSLIDHAVVRYAGCNNYGNIHLTNASPTIRYTDLTNGYRGINATTSTPNLICNNIFGNTQYGLYNATTGTNISAEYQWWGDATGPYHSTNLSGLGNAVTDGVDFTPWATSPCVEVLPEITFSMATYSVSEAGGNATITVNLSSPSSSIVTANYATSNGSATAGSDYYATAGTLTFNPGDTSETFTVEIINDSFDEPNETINLTLSGPVNAVLGTPSEVILTIEDDDEPGATYLTMLPIIVKSED
jgi:hypothetical protein